MSTPTDILWYGRGGQGAFSAAKLLGASYAFSGDDTFALAFPSFGPERRGAPVRAYTKLSSTPVNDRSAIVLPDFAICLDSTLLQDFAGMQIKEGGFVLTTTPCIEEFATEHLGRPIVNTTLLALLCAKTGLLTVGDIEVGIKQTLPERIQQKNIALVNAAFESADSLLEESVSVPSNEDVGAKPEEQASQQSQQQGRPDMGFEYMNLLTADSFNAPQRVYGVPSEGGEQ